MSPQFLNATMPPTKRPNAEAILIFPESFSGAKTSVRRNLGGGLLAFEQARRER